MRCTHSPHEVLRPQRLLILAIAVSEIINRVAYCNPTPWETPQKLLICVDPLGECFLSAVDLRQLENINVINDIDKLNCGVSDLSTIATNEVIEVFTADTSRKYGIMCKNINLIPLEKLLKVKTRIKRQSSYPRGRFRGQTQSQYLNIGNDGNEGKAEAQSVADSSRAIVTGTSGMGQAQSQTIYDPGCDECGQSSDPGVDSLRRYPDANKDIPSFNKNNFGQPIAGGTNSPYRPFSTTAQQPDSRQGSIQTEFTLPGQSRKPDIQTPVNQFAPSTNGPNAPPPGPNYIGGGGTSQGPVGPYGTTDSGTNGPRQGGSGTNGLNPGGSGIYGQIPGGGGWYGPNQDTRGTNGQSPVGRGTYGQNPGGSGTYAQGGPTGVGSGNYGQSPVGSGTYGQRPVGSGTYAQGGPTGVGSGNYGQRPVGSGTYGQNPGGSNTYGQSPGASNTFGQSPGGAATYGHVQGGPSSPGGSSSLGGLNGPGGPSSPGGSSGPTGPGGSKSNTPDTGLSRPHGQLPGGSDTYGQIPGGSGTYGQSPDGSGSNIPNAVINGLYGQNTGGSGTYGQIPGGSGTYGQSPGVAATYGQGPSVSVNYGPSLGSGPGGPGGSESNIPNTGINGAYGQIPGSGTYGKGPIESGTYGQSPVGSGTYGQRPVESGTYGQRPVGSGTYGQNPGGSGSYGQRPVGSGTYGQNPGGSGTYGQSPVGSGTYGQSPVGSGTYGQRPVGSGTYGQNPGGSNTYGKSPGASNTFGQSPGGAATYGHVQGGPSSPGGSSGLGGSSGPGGLNGPGGPSSPGGSSGPGGLNSPGGSNGPGGSGSNIPNTSITTPNGQSPGGSGFYGQNLGGGVTYGQSPGESDDYRPSPGSLGASEINRPNTGISGPYGQRPGVSGIYGQSPGSSFRNPAGVSGNGHNEQSSGVPGDSSVTNVPQNIVSPQLGSVWPQIGPNGEKYVCCLVNSSYPSTPLHGGSNQPQGLIPNQITGNSPGASYGPTAPHQTGTSQPWIQSNQQSSPNRQENYSNNNIMNGPGPNHQNQPGRPIPGNIYPQSNQLQGTLGSTYQQPYNLGTSPYGAGTSPQTTGISSSLPYDATKPQNTNTDSIFQGSAPYNPSNNRPGETLPGSSGQSQYNIPQGIPGTSNTNINPQGYTTNGVNNLPGATVPDSNWNTNSYTGGNIPNTQSPGIGQNGMPLQTGQTSVTPNSQNLPQSFSQQGNIPGSRYPGQTDSGYNYISPYNNEGGGPGVINSQNNVPTGSFNSNQGYIPNGTPNIGATQGGQNNYGNYPQGKQPGIQGSSIPGSSNDGSKILNYNTPELAGGQGPYNGYVQGSDSSAPGMLYVNQGSQGQLPSSSYGNQGQSNIPNQQPTYAGKINGPTPDDSSLGIPQNVVDPNSIAATYDDDSEALVSVSQNVNGTVASASSKGGNDKGRAQTQVEGTYTGTGSFSAQAQISDDTKGAESHVSGSKHGATSSALGKGRNNKSQAQVQLGSETGSLQTQAGTDGVMHSSNSQVQGSVKGGMADAQARGPGSTSSQAQIGFTPYKDTEKAVHDALKSPFVGGGTASAHSTGRTGQSQTQLQGTFKYGISYNGAAQSGASLDKDAVFTNRLAFNKLDVFDENNKNINVNVEQPANPPTSATQTNEHPHSDHHNTRVDQQNEDAANPANGRRSFKSSQDNNAEYEYPTDKDDNQPYEYETDGSYDPEVTEGDYPNYDDSNRELDPLQQTQQNSERKSLEVKQTLGGNTQHIILGPLHNRDAQIVQQSSDQRPDENRIYQPGELVPGTGGYTIPIGFTGSVKAVSSKGKTYAIGSKDSPSQAQTVSLSPGTGKVKYDRPIPTYSYGRNVPQQDLRSLDDKQEDNNRYMSVSKTVTGALDGNNNVKKQYSHTYYTKSSSCGYFTFTCTMVSGSDGRKKICRPKIPTNPDGTPMKC